MRCTICGSKLNGCLCPGCGFDLSQDREQYPTLANDGRNPVAVWKTKNIRFRDSGQSAAARPDPAAANQAYPQAGYQQAYAPPAYPQAQAYAPPAYPQGQAYEPSAYVPPAYPQAQPGSRTQPVTVGKKPGSRGKLIAAVAGLAAVLVVVLVLVLGGKGSGNGSSTDNPAASASQNSELATTTEAPEPEERVTQVLHLDGNSLNLSKVSGNWIVYHGENKKVGLLSLDGTTDTGAIFSRAYTYENHPYAKVTTDSSELTTDPASINRFGLIDGSGKQILPEEYASFTILGRYIRASKVTEKISDSTYNLCSFSGDFFTTKQSSYCYYNGTWTVYDTQTGDFVPNLSGANGRYFKRMGCFFRYENYDSNWKNPVTVTVGPDGQPARSDVTLMDNGSYVVREPSSATLCRSDGSEIFRFDPTAFSVTWKKDVVGSQGVYLAVINSTDGTRYALLDETGAFASVEFDQQVSPAGPYLMTYDSHLVQKDGTAVTENKISSFAYDERGGCFEDTEGNDTFFDSDGKLLLTVQKSDTIAPRGSNDCFFVRKAVSGGYSFYSFKDGDYTLTSKDGTFYTHWLVQTSNNGGSYNLVDSLTGETLLAGYDSYSVHDADGKRYVVAVLNSNNTWDVFRLN